MKLNLTKNSIPLAIMLFFMLIGYLEASWVGLVSAFVLSSVAILLINICVVPFIGVALWYYSFNYLSSNVLSFLPVKDLITKINYFMLGTGIIITALTSTFTVVVIILFIKYRGIFTKNSMLPFNWLNVKELIKSNNKTIDSLIESVIGYLGEVIDQVNKKIVGSILFWFGLGISTHDFWWESTEEDVDVRLTHGGYEGLNLALSGMQIIVWGNGLNDQIKNNLIFYLGYALSFVGFSILFILPKGLIRIVSHVLWWSGLALMIYNWYLLVRDDLIKEDIKLQKKVV